MEPTGSRKPGSGRQSPGDPHSPPSPLETTADLLTRIRAGDQRALNDLFKRILKPLQRFAHGRLPYWARDRMDTEDIVQSTIIRALDKVDEFDSRHEGAFMAYLRTGVLNRVRDEIRRYKHLPERVEWSDAFPGQGLSPLEAAIGKEAVERYDEALSKLPADPQVAVMLHLEMRYTYKEIARTMNLVSADAARMMTTRAIAKLAKLMRPLRPDGA